MERQHIKTYEEMRQYVADAIESNWDFVEGDSTCMYMSCSVMGYYVHSASVVWQSGREAEEMVEADALAWVCGMHDATPEEWEDLRYSMDPGDQPRRLELIRAYDARKDDIWESYYMGACDTEETQRCIDRLAHSLWDQWGASEL